MTVAPQVPHVVTFGETMALLEQDDIGPLRFTRRMNLRSGGAESNVAIGLRRLGVHASWIGRVGADALGERILHDLRGEQVDVRELVIPDRPTGLMLKERRGADIARVWYYRAGSAGSTLQPSDLPETLLRGASLLHITGITSALSSSAADAVQHALDIAEAAAVPVSFDVNHRDALWDHDSAAASYRRIAARAAVVFAGLDEARLLATNADSAESAAAAIAALGPKEVVIKLGPNGCYALVDQQEYHQPAVPVRAIDTVGAGDAFVAGYLAERLGGARVEARLRTAVATGAFACLAPGDWEGFARRSELGLLAAADPISR